MENTNPTANEQNISASLTPRQVVELLDKYIVGQSEAKRAVAIALRNRYRRQRLTNEMRDEVSPKNILMIGPTGVGKTEIARRVAKLIDAPFLKIEATKFTEAGYVGRDVDSIIRDITEIAFNIVHDEKIAEVKEQAETTANEKLIGYIVATQARRREEQRARGKRKATPEPEEATAEPTEPPSEQVSEKRSAQPRPRAVPAAQPKPNPALERRLRAARRRVAQQLAAQQLEDEQVEIDLEGGPDMEFSNIIEFMPGMSPDEMSDSFRDFLDNVQQMSNHRRSRKMSVKEARRVLINEESHKLLDFESIVEQTIKRVENTGVVFIDEIDKIIGSNVDVGPDVSNEGVQRDLLPIVEGSVVMTRYGQVKSDHILFIAAGAFHQNKPSDLIPELQGRFPLRVELASLEQEDLEAILVQPENALTKQYQALLATEDVTLEFTSDGLGRIAAFAAEMNAHTEDIGARRLHTIMEKVLEEVSFDAADKPGTTVVVDAKYVDDKIGDLVEDEDLSRFIL